MTILKCDFVVLTICMVDILTVNGYLWEDKPLPKCYVRAMVPELLTGSLYHSLKYCYRWILSCVPLSISLWYTHACTCTGTLYGDLI